MLGIYKNKGYKLDPSTKPGDVRAGTRASTFMWPDKRQILSTRVRKPEILSQHYSGASDSQSRAHTNRLVFYDLMLPRVFARNTCSRTETKLGGPNESFFMYIGWNDRWEIWSSVSFRLFTCPFWIFYCQRDGSPISAASRRGIHLLGFFTSVGFIQSSNGLKYPSGFWYLIRSGSGAHPTRKKIRYRKYVVLYFLKYKNILYY